MHARITYLKCPKYLWNIGQYKIGSTYTMFICGKTQQLVTINNEQSESENIEGTRSDDNNKEIRPSTVLSSQESNKDINKKQIIINNKEVAQNKSKYASTSVILPTINNEKKISATASAVTTLSSKSGKRQATNNLKSPKNTK